MHIVLCCLIHKRRFYCLYVFWSWMNWLTWTGKKWMNWINSWEWPTSRSGRHYSNRRAETEALKQAASLIPAAGDDCRQVVFLVDALSVLHACQTHRLLFLSTALQRVARTWSAVLQWIPAHCGLSGHERADVLAKEGAREEQPDNSISCSEEKSITKALSIRRTHRGD